MSNTVIKRPLAAVLHFLKALLPLAFCYFLTEGLAAMLLSMAGYTGEEGNE